MKKQQYHKDILKDHGYKPLFWKVIGENGEWTGESVITEVFSEASQYELGSVLPKAYGGFCTTLKAYGIDFTAQFSFQVTDEKY